MTYLRCIKKLFNKENIMPECVTFFITNKCNLRCRHCFYLKELNKPKETLTLEEIQRLSETMDNFVLLTLTGGEPFLRKDIGKIAKIFYKNNKIKYLVIPTNGTIEIKETLKEIIRECPKLKIRLLVSIEDTRESYDKSIETFKKLRGLDINLGTITTFSSLNQDRIFEVYREIKSLNPDTINFPLIRGDVDKSIKNINIGIYESLMMEIKSRGLIGRAKKLMTEINIQTIRENKRIIPCYAGTINAVIYPDGDVYPCELSNKKMGNLYEYDLIFRKLWLSYRSEQTRKEIKDCYCTHECNMLPNVIFNPRLISKWIIGGTE